MEETQIIGNPVTCKGYASRSTCPCDPNDLSSSVSEEKPKIQYEKLSGSILRPSRFEKQSPNAGEMSIIFNSIVDLLNHMLDKLELVATIPLLLKDSELKQILTADEFEMVKNAFTDEDKESSKIESCETDKPVCDSVILVPKNRISMSTTISRKTRSKNRSLSELSPSSSTDSTPSSEFTIESEEVELHWGIFDALEILNSYPRIREMVQDNLNDIVPAATQFLGHLQFVIQHILSEMRLTPEQAREKELFYRQAYRDQKQYKKDLTKFTIDLENNRESFKKRMEGIVTQYSKDMVTIDGINKRCAESLEYISIKYEKKQHVAYKLSEQKQNELQYAVTNAKENLDKLRESNLTIEQHIRNRRFKVQSQLQGILNKFDTEIGERQRLYDELVDTYQADKAERIQLEAFINAVEYLYYGEEEEGEIEDLDIDY